MPLRQSAGKMLIVLAAGCALSSCGALAPRPRVDVRLAVGDTLFALGVGQAALASDGVTRFTFFGVSGDSRCPIGVMCIQAGDAVAQVGIAFGSGPTTPYQLHLLQSPQGADAGGWRLTFTGLEPPRPQSGAIPPGSYIATFLLQPTRVPAAATPRP